MLSRDRETAVFVASGLPELPDAQTYELWLVGPGGPRPAGLLTASSEPQPLTLGDATAIAVSREEAGGAQQPSSIVKELTF